MTDLQERIDEQHKRFQNLKAEEEKVRMKLRAILDQQLKIVGRVNALEELRDEQQPPAPEPEEVAKPNGRSRGDAGPE